MNFKEKNQKDVEIQDFLTREAKWNRFCGKLCLQEILQSEKAGIQGRGRLRGKLLDSGFFEDQTYGALAKALLAYAFSCKHDNSQRREYYDAVIYKNWKENRTSIISICGD